MRLLTGGTLLVALLMALLVHGDTSERRLVRFTRSPGDMAAFSRPSAAARRHQLVAPPVEVQRRAAGIPPESTVE
jgi:hypothetical protein